MDTIAQKLSWEIVAMNDAGIASEEVRLALEIAYGISLQIHDSPVQFSLLMASITTQVSDPMMQAALRYWGKRGLKR